MTPFLMTLNSPNQDFKVTPLFDAEYLSKKVQDTDVVTMEYS